MNLVHKNTDERMQLMQDSSSEETDDDEDEGAVARIKPLKKKPK